MGQSNIHEKAMLANLTIRTWTASKTDKRVTHDVAQRENASSSAGRYAKRLVSKDALGDVQSAASAARAIHYKLTLPWSDEGSRILSASTYLDYTRELRTVKSAFYDAAEKFFDGYEDYVRNAEITLGGMFNKDDYPSLDKIRQKFAMEINVFPLPTSDDFRVKLPDGELETVRAEIEENVRQSLARGQRNIYERVQDVVLHMATKLREYEPSKTSGKRAQGIFRDSLITNVRELAVLMPSLNITGDPIIAELSEELKDLAYFEPDALREDPHLRETQAKTADEILDRLKGYMT